MEALPEAERDQVFEDLCLAYPAVFFEALVELEGEPLVFEEYQLRYLLDPHPFKVTKKARQAGGSMMVAAEIFHNAYTRPGYRCDIVSVNQTEATDKIRYIRNFHETLPKAWRHELTVDNALSIGFRRGGLQSVVKSLAASAGVRGGKKDIFFDEFAFVPNAGDLFVAALPATIRGNGGMKLVSTPMGMVGKFWEIATNLDNRFANWSRHEFGWWDVSDFTTDHVAARRAWVEEYERNISAMHELFERFAGDKLRMIAESFAWEEFLQEFCCHFVDEATAYYSWELINRQRKDHTEDAAGWIEPWDHERPEGNDDQAFMGVDFAEGRRGGDETSVQVVSKDEAEGGRLVQRFYADLAGPEWNDFDKQVHHIAGIARRMKVQRVTVDETGLGRKIAQDLKKLLGNIVEPVTFTNVNKEQMAQEVKGLLERDLLWIQYRNKNLAHQIHGMKRTRLPSGMLRYHGEPHDDMFWALALACKGEGRPEFRIWSVG